MQSDHLDYTPLTQRVGLRSRLRTLAGDNLMVMGMTVGVLLTAGPLAVFLIQVVTGNLGGFGWFCIGFLFPCGVWVLGSGLYQAGKGGAVAAFARANGLRLVQGSAATSYAGSFFADGTHVVRQSVRTRDETFVEVGDRWPVTTPKLRTNSVTDTVQAEVRTPELFLRVRLSGRVSPGGSAAEVVTTALDAELRQLAGAYTIEVTDRELTVFGTRELELTDADRMKQALGLAERLAEAAEAELVGDAPEPTASGIPIPEVGTRSSGGRMMGAVKVVGITIALFIIAPLVFAAVMSVADDNLRGRGGVAQVVVYLAVMALVGVVGWVVRLITRPQRSRPGRTIAIAIAVILGTIGIMAWAIANDDDSSGSERAHQTEPTPTAAPPTQPMLPTSEPPEPEYDCPKGDHLCEAWTATADWMQQHELVSSGGMDAWRDCAKLGDGRRSCNIMVRCTGGNAKLSLLFDGPSRIVGARPRGALETPPAVTLPEVDRLVQQQCS